jgi:hypothetical protein
MLYAAWRRLHTYVADILFATFHAHLGAALLHGLVYRDGVFASMAPWRSRAARPHRLARTPAMTSYTSDPMAAPPAPTTMSPSGSPRAASNSGKT